MTTRTQNAPARRKGLGVASLGFLTGAAIVTSVRGFPVFARTEMTMFVYFAFAVIFFLIPGALVSAELGGMFSRAEGGVYRWVREAFHERWGFTAQWLQWIQNVVWYPVGFAFVAAGAAYLIDKPGLASNRYYIGAFVIIAYWLCTLVVLRGPEFFAKAASWMFMTGTVLPGIVLVSLFGYWVASGHPIGWQGTLGPGLGRHGHPAFWPAFTGLSSIAFLAGFILLYAGVETQAVHVRDMRRPRSFPKAVLIGAAIGAGIYIIGALAIAGVVPYGRLSLASAVFYSFNLVLGQTLHVGWVANILDLLVVLGALAGPLAWLGGPPRGLLATTQDGVFPPILQKVNKKKMPVGILVPQGFIVTLIACIYFAMKDVSVGFFLIGALTIALYLLMYLLMYSAGLRLRYSRPGQARAFAVPGGNAGMWIVAGVGFLGAAFAFVTSFFPPTLLPIGTPATYVILVAVGTIVLGGLPILLYQTRRNSWVNMSFQPLPDGRAEYLTATQLAGQPNPATPPWHEPDHAPNGHARPEPHGAAQEKETTPGDPRKRPSRADGRASRRGIMRRKTEQTQVG